MSGTVDEVLAARLEAVGGARRWPSFATSLGLHLLLVAVFLIGPLLLVGPPVPMEFVPVQLVPLQALGVRSPAPAPSPPAPRPAAPAPESARPAPAPAREEPKPAPPSPPRPAPAERPRPAAPAGEAATGPAQRQGSPLGSSLGTAAFGATVGGLDNPDFVYGYYVDQMLSMISSNWVRPVIGGQIEAEVHFRISRDGGVSDVRVVRSSGYNSFDLAGLRAVQLAAPLPPLPDSFPHASLGVSLVLR